MLWEHDDNRWMMHSDYLEHYGIPGQKKGVRRFQYEGGGYTPEGAARYWGGTGQGRRRSGTTGQTSRTPRVQRTASSGQAPSSAKPVSAKPKLTAKQQAARRAKVKKVIAISAGVAVAAALGYAAYKGSTNLRDQMRGDILKNMSKGHESINSLNSKYWNAADRTKYNQMTKERAKFVADNFTRRDAVSAKLYEKTGVRVNLPQSRAKVLAERRSEQRLSNFFNQAEKRGALNRSIHDARADLKSAQKRLSDYTNTQRIGTSKQYEQLWTQKYKENVDAAKDRLDDLLRKRVA